MYKGINYRRGYYLTKSFENIVSLFEIIEFVSINDNLYVVLKSIELSYFSDHLQSYILSNRNISNFKYFVKDLNGFDGPPVHVYLLPDGNNALRLKRFFI